MSDNTVTFSVQMKTLYMFNFLYTNSYSGSRGIINYGFSLVGIIALIFGFGDSIISRIALIILASLFTVVEPLLLLFKAWTQVKTNPTFKNPVEYTFKTEGITLKQGETEQEAPWEMILLAMENHMSIILFTGNNNAVILPKKDIGEQLDNFKLLLKENRPEQCGKIK